MKATSPSTDPGRLRREIDALGPWFHNLHLPGGVETAPGHPLGDFPSYKWARLAPCLPERLDGWTALDVGCNAGFYAFELARRGARVVGLDHDEHYLAQARFAAGVLGVGDRVEFRRGAVYDLAEVDDRFDLVLFLGVFYHLRYPLLGLDIVSRLARRLFIFQSLTLPGREEAALPPDFGMDERARLEAPGAPRMAFVEQRLAGDPTNWWVPNHAAALALLRSCGQRVVASPGHELYVCEPDPSCCLMPPDPEEFEAATGRSRRRTR